MNHGQEQENWLFVARCKLVADGEQIEVGYGLRPGLLSEVKTAFESFFGEIGSRPETGFPVPCFLDEPEPNVLSRSLKYVSPRKIALTAVASFPPASCFIK